MPELQRKPPRAANQEDLTHALRALERLFDRHKHTLNIHAKAEAIAAVDHVFECFRVGPSRWAEAEEQIEITMRMLLNEVYEDETVQ